MSQLPPRVEIGFAPSSPKVVSMAQAFAFSLTDIAGYMDYVANNAADLCERNERVGDAIALARAAQDIYAVVDPEQRDKPRGSVLYPDKDLTDPRLNFDYNGTQIRSTTLYDTLAYVLSVTGTLPANTPTTHPIRDYYLPLTSLYANWCFKIAAFVKDTRPGGDLGVFLYHIAYFTQGIPGRGTKVLLGSSIGGNESMRTPIKDTRASTLEKLGFVEPEPLKGAQNFGGCAETSFFMYAKQAQPIENSASGFAMNLSRLSPNDLAVYDEGRMTTCLQNPCQQSCQQLFRELGWAGNPTFRIDVIKKSLPPV